MYTEQEINAADEILDMIVGYKRELGLFLTPGASGLKDGAKEMSAVMEESFDDAYHAEWVKNREISGDIRWPIHIPPLGTLSFRTPVEKAHDLYKSNCLFQPMRIYD